MARSFMTGINDAYIPLHFLSMLPASAERWLIDASAAPGFGRLLAWALDVPLYVYSGFLGILLLITNPSGPRRLR